MDIRLTSGKIISLADVLHVTEISKNIVSGALLTKHDFKLVFESNKFVLTKNGNSVGKGYVVGGM